MLNPFEQLRIFSTSAPHDFEEAAWHVIRATEPAIRRIALSRGDGGIDFAQGAFGEQGEVHVFQCKYFPDKIEDSQKRQIRDSFETAKSNSLIQLKEWTLVLPARLRRECLHWFETWKASLEPGIETSLLDGDDLADLLRDPRSGQARDFLRAKGVQGIVGDGAVLTPFVQTFMATNLGIGYVVNVRVQNLGNRSAIDPRITIQHTQTGCIGAVHDPNWWNQEQETFMTVNPRRLVGLRDIHPTEAAQVLQIPLRKGDHFEMEILVQIAAKDCPLQHWYFKVSPEEMANGAQASRVEVAPELVEQVRQKVARPRTIGKPEPVSPLAAWLLDLILGSPDKDALGLTIIRSAHPSDLSKAFFIPSLNAGGKSPHFAPKDDFEAAVVELQEMGWLGNPHMDHAIIVYSYKEN